ncbi:MAG: cbb3-type cytochrome c oxidase subunit 3 [Litoreibacter sp.]|nr:cbb3-type cytochrome c oxidase subunit 3 [Litoreibacter sp.]
MDTYTLLREFADSWFLIAMFAFFIGTWVFAFWPSLKGDREAAASIPFRDEAPACTKDCATCACTTDFLKGAENG